MNRLYLSQKEIHDYFHSDHGDSRAERESDFTDYITGGGINTFKNPYDLIFNYGHKDRIQINEKSVILQAHQLIPLLYFTCQSDKLILNYGMGSGKTLAAVYILYYYHNLNKLKQVLNSDSKRRQSEQYKLFVVGEWQTRDAFLKEMKRPQFDFSERYDLRLSDFEQSVKRYVNFLTYQGLFNEVFPDIDIEQEPEILQNLFRDNLLEIDHAVLERLENSIFVVDELQRLYSEGTGLNSYGIALTALSKECKNHNIKILMLSGTLINSDIEELKSLFEIVDPDTFKDIYDEKSGNVEITDFYSILNNKLFVYNPKDFVKEDINVEIRHIGNYDLGIDHKFKDKALTDFKLMSVDSDNVQYKFLPNLSGIKDYSALTDFVLNEIKEKLKAGERCVIYSDDLKKFGIDLYEHLFNQSGYVCYGNPINPYTLCRNCLKTRTNCICETFRPIIYGVLKGQISMDQRNRMVELYNQPNSPISLMLISSVAQSGVTLKETNNIFIVNTPYSFPKYLQTIYRVIRKDSHINMPKEKRYVNVYNMSTPHENERYKEKISKFILIDQWEKDIYNHIKGTDLFLKRKLEVEKITDENKIFNYLISLDVSNLVKRLDIDFRDIFRVSEFIKSIRQTHSALFDLNIFTDEELFSLIMLDKNLYLFKLDLSEMDKTSKKIFEETQIGKRLFCDENELCIGRHKFFYEDEKNNYITIKSDDVFSYFKNAEN